MNKFFYIVILQTVCQLLEEVRLVCSMWARCDHRFSKKAQFWLFSGTLEIILASDSHYIMFHVVE